MNLVALGRHAQSFRTAPSDGTHIGVLLIVFFEHQLLGGVDLGHRIGNIEIQNARRILQPLAVLGASKNPSAIGALALKYADRIMQTMREYADLGFGSRNELAVEPDQIRTLVEGHCHGIASLASLFPMRAESGPAMGLLHRNRRPVMVCAAS